VWDDKSLDAYLASPEKFIPGNVMAFPDLSEAKDRANLMAYLNTLM
jgi:cytochrome c